MTRIFGTLGPACSSQNVLEEMLNNGMTGIRLNLSHCDLADSAPQIHAFHAACKAVGVLAELVIDTQGPELRIGDMPSMELSSGDEVILGVGGIPIPGVIYQFLDDGMEVLLDDGKISLTVTSREQRRAIVGRGGVLTARKSIKIPGKTLALPVLTERDRKNICHAADYGVTGLLQPFVHNGTELLELRHELKELNAEHLKIYAKIETLEGVKNLENILPHADVIVIARGDLGNDMPLWQLPSVQKVISMMCQAAGKPFIVVTQMLASMESSPVPTRAEVSDIFNAVVDGAWGVMLTGETAIGKHPVEAIRYLTNTSDSACRWVASK